MEKIKSKYKNNLDEILFIINIFLCFSSFLGIGSYLFIIIATIHIINMIFRKKILINKTFILSFILILIFIVSYEFIKSRYINISLIKLLYHIYVPIISFTYAYCILNFSNQRKMETIINYITIIICSLFLHGLLNMLYEILLGMPNLLNPNARYIIDIWTNNRVTATILNSYIFLTLAFIPIFFFYTKYSIKIRSILLAFTFISLVISITTASRTFILGFLITVFICILFLLKSGTKFNLKILLLILSLIIICFIFNIFQLKDFILNSFLVQRLTSGGFNLLNDPRIQAWIEVLSKIFIYPFGGGYELNAGLRFAHNMWLDIAYTAGIIPFIFIILITILMIYFVYASIKIEAQYRYIIVIFTMNLFLLCFLEPIIEGYYNIFILFFITFGLFCNMSLYDKKIIIRQS